MHQTNDNKPYSEEKAGDALGGSITNGSSRTQGPAQSSPAVLRGLIRMLEILYQFTIGSCIYTLQPNCSRPNHDNAADQYEVIKIDNLNNIKSKHASREAKREEFKKLAASRLK